MLKPHGVAVSLKPEWGQTLFELAKQPMLKVRIIFKVFLAINGLQIEASDFMENKQDL